MRRAGDGVRDRLHLAELRRRIPGGRDGLGDGVPSVGHRLGGYCRAHGGGWGQGVSGQEQGRCLPGTGKSARRRAGYGSPGSVVVAGEKTVVLVLMVRVSSSVLVEVTEPRDDQPLVTVVVARHVVEYE